MKTDSLFYRLFQERPELAFELAGWPVPAGGRYTLRAEEVKQTSFRLMVRRVVFVVASAQSATALAGGGDLSGSNSGQWRNGVLSTAAG